MLLLRSVAHRTGPINGPWLNVLHILSQNEDVDCWEPAFRADQMHHACSNPFQAMFHWA